LFEQLDDLSGDIELLCAGVARNAAEPWNGRQRRDRGRRCTVRNAASSQAEGSPTLV